MALLRIDAHGPEPHAACGAPFANALLDHLAPVPHGATIVIFTHGMRHNPFDADRSPHDGLLAARANPARHWKARSLVRGMHMGTGQRLDGQGIAFGWQATGSVWAALRTARVAGRALRRVAMAIRRDRPD
ncbi:MAG: hypothetical protein WBA67_08670, partial [Jannaschia sp.]